MATSADHDAGGGHSLDSEEDALVDVRSTVALTRGHVNAGVATQHARTRASVGAEDAEAVHAGMLAGELTVSPFVAVLRLAPIANAARALDARSSLPVASPRTAGSLPTFCPRIAA